MYVVKPCGMWENIHKLKVRRYLYVVKLCGMWEDIHKLKVTLFVRCQTLRYVRGHTGAEGDAICTLSNLAVCERAYRSWRLDAICTLSNLAVCERAYRRWRLGAICTLSDLPVRERAYRSWRLGAICTLSDLPVGERAYRSWRLNAICTLSMWVLAYFSLLSSVTDIIMLIDTHLPSTTTTLKYSSTNHLNTYVLGLQPLSILNLFQWGERL